MTVVEQLVDQIVRAREWTLLLVADLDGNDWKFQPAAGMGHPLWLCGHLAVAQHRLIHERCLNTSFIDPDFAKHFPIGAAVLSADEHAYPEPAAILETMASVQERTIEAVRGMREEQFNEPAFGKHGEVHPHYRDKRGAVAHCSRHEVFHAGQLATIRRLLGKPFLR